MAIPNIWRTKKQRYSLEGAVCPTCNTTMFPPRKQCRACRAMNATAPTSVEGEPYSYFMVFDLSQSTEATIAGDD